METKKGLSLPINMIVIVAIAVLVLVVIAAFFATQTGGGFETIKINTAFSEGCNTLQSAIFNCDYREVGAISTNYVEPGTNVKASLFKVCQLKDPNIVRQEQCAIACGCRA